MHSKLRKNKAFTLVEIMIVVAIIALLIVLALPNFVKSRTTARLRLCDNNLRLIGHAAEQYIINNNLADTTVVTNAQAQVYCLGGVPTCPSGGVYTIASETVGGNSGPTVACNAAGHHTYHALSGQAT
jgi:prepilin-type N-terminal cleavage/methylation domain-containing protein